MQSPVHAAALASLSSAHTSSATRRLVDFEVAIAARNNLEAAQAGAATCGRVHERRSFFLHSSGVPQAGTCRAHTCSKAHRDDERQRAAGHLSDLPDEAIELPLLLTIPPAQLKQIKIINERPVAANSTVLLHVLNHCPFPPCRDPIQPWARFIKIFPSSLPRSPTYPYSRRAQTFRIFHGKATF